MPIQHRSSDDGARIDINITGRFDFMLTREFRGIYMEQQQDAPVDYHIDLSMTDFMDSTALGMLLLLRDYAAKNGSAVYIENPSIKAEMTLRTANFEQLFKINKAA